MALRYTVDPMDLTPTDEEVNNYIETLLPLWRMMVLENKEGLMYLPLLQQTLRLHMGRMNAMVSDSKFQNKLQLALKQQLQDEADALDAEKDASILN